MTGWDIVGVAAAVATVALAVYRIWAEADTWRLLEETEDIHEAHMVLLTRDDAP